MSVISPNMGLVISTVNTDSGLEWEENLNSSLTILDQHNHTPGNGVQIPTSGLNISSALSFQNNSATSLSSIVFTPQISVATDTAVYCIDADLYFNDGNGNVVQITSGGNVNATSSGISSGSASASFVASVLVVNAASTTPANIQGASVLLGNNSAGSKYLTLSPPAAMGANYTLTLPTLPVAQQFVTLDASGNMSAPWAVDNASIVVDSNVVKVPDQGITAAKIANDAVTTGKILGGNVTRSKLEALGQQTSSSCNSFSTLSTSYVDVTNLSVTISSVPSGRPLFIQLISDGSGNLSTMGPNGASPVNLKILRDSTEIYTTQFNSLLPTSCITHFDAPAQGSYTYKVQLKSVGGAAVQITYTKLNVFVL